jgi:hypothetical protein
MFESVRKALSPLYGALPLVRELRVIMHNIERLERRLLTVEQMRMLDFELQRHPRYADPLRLFRRTAQICSQDGSDGAVHEVFGRIGTTNRVFLEIGVGDGRENNTAFLLSNGWTGYWIDGDAGFLGALQGREDIPASALKHLVAFVSRENAGKLLQELGVPTEFDFLSLDIDQNTYYAWEGLAAFKPRVIAIEYNAAIPPDVDWKANYRPDRVWDGTQNYGAGLKAFELLGRRLGYSLVGCDFIGTNAFFVRADLAAGKFAEPFTAENHYEPPRYILGQRRGAMNSILDRRAG